MKRSILLILAATLTFALTGCGGGENTVTTPTTTTPATTTPTTSITMKVNSASLVDYDAVLGGVYHTSAPGTIKIKYDISYYVNKTIDKLNMTVHLSNSSSISKVWEEINFAQLLAAKTIVDTSTSFTENVINQVGEIITSNSTAMYMVQPTPYSVNIEYTKPTYLLVTLYGIIPYVPTPADLANTDPYYVMPSSTYVSSQVAIPVTIFP